mgnify:FL=1
MSKQSCLWEAVRGEGHGPGEQWICGAVQLMGGAATQRRDPRERLAAIPLEDHFPVSPSASHLLFGKGYGLADLFYRPANCHDHLIPGRACFDLNLTVKRIHPE